MSTIPIDQPSEVAAAAGQSRHAASQLAAEQADKHRAAIRKFAAEKGLSIAQLGRSIGLNTGNAFYNFFRGRSSAMSLTTLTRICDCFPGTTLDQLAGRDTAPLAVTPRISTQTEDGESLSSVTATAADAPTNQQKLHPTGPHHDPPNSCHAAFGELEESLRSLRLAIDDLEHNCRRASATMAKMSSVA